MSNTTKIDLSPVLSIRPTSSIEQISEAQGRLAYAKRLIKEVADQLEDVLVEKCECEGGFTIGEIRYYAGMQKDKKVRDINVAVHEVFRATDGDLDELIRCIASNGLKHGTVASIVGPEQAELLIETKERPRLKEGKAKKSLLSMNPNF